MTSSVATFREAPRSRGERAPHLVLIVGTSDSAHALQRAGMVPALAGMGRVTVLSAVDVDTLPIPLRPPERWVFPLVPYPERRLLRSFRSVIDASPATFLPLLAALERRAALALRPAWDRDEVAEMLDLLAPALILNCSPVSLPAAELPLRLARQRGIPTAACILSAADLASRARLIALYDLYVVPDRPTRERLLRLLPGIAPSIIFGESVALPEDAASKPASVYQAFTSWWHDGAVGAGRV